ncbi:hypothetical protein CL629_00370 [bacterium]|nr:hypothetical protein [bacterium]|tara:strand:- start:1173 stop:1394 length:222 start_codon:yes stop_codon:yes gene_type:complete
MTADLPGELVHPDLATHRAKLERRFHDQLTQQATLERRLQRATSDDELRQTLTRELRILGTRAIPATIMQLGG